MKIKFIKFKKLSDTAIMPTKAHAYDAGFDLFADEDCMLMYGETKVVQTNIAIEFRGLSIHTKEGGGMKIFKTDPSDEWEEYEDINHRLIRELKNYADAGVISPEDYQKQVCYLEMEKALNKPTESNSRIYTTVTDSVNHPAHYNVGGIETIDVIRAMLTPEEYRGYLKGNVLKYRERAPYKHETPDEDHAKAKVYWELLQEAEGERIFE